MVLFLFHLKMINCLIKGVLGLTVLIKNFMTYEYYCLIPKYPFIEQIEKCLKSIIIFLNIEEESIENLNAFITYIVKTISCIPHQSKIFFPIPFYNKFIEIKKPYLRDINQFYNNSIIISNNLSA